LLNLSSILKFVQSRFSVGNKIFLIFCVFPFSSKIDAQINRISNGSFEEYDICPTFYGTPSNQQLQHSIGWQVPTVASSDYFNSCATIASNVNVPYNILDYQMAFDGNCYAGFYLLAEQNYREYIQTKFNRPMIKGNNYEVRFWVSLAASSSRSISSIGAFLSDYQIQDYTTDANFHVIPQIENPAGNYIDDSIGWTLISGIYTALGNEQYITIGNFRDSADTDANPPGFQIAYYFIDDVQVISLSEEQLLPNVFTPNGDGINDYISFSDFGLEKVDCKIYDRWGNLVTRIDDIKGSWNGIGAEDGVYYYIIEGKELDQTEIYQKGFIQLLR
jgi:gliding motility-associated-like protein